MKIAITGHTSGLGKSFYDLATENSIDVVGFSRANGFDITNSNNRTDIVKNADDCDVFINNAYDRYGQIDLLYDMYESWKGKEKLIVTIGSYAANAAEWRLEPCLYSTVKKALDTVTYQLVNSHKRQCKVMIVKPGYLGTGNNKIPYSEAAEILLTTILNNKYEMIELVIR